MKLLSILYLILLTSSLLFALDVQGEKIVLNSFSTFDEAQAKLKELESKITPDEIKLQNTYHFDFVARKSGRAYIVVIEPIKTVDNAKTILKHFKKTYTDAYTDHYYGPTQAAIKLSMPSTPTPKEINQTKTPPLPKIAKIAQKNVPISKVAELVTKEEDKNGGGYDWLWIPTLVLIFIGGLIFIRKGFNSQRKIFDDNDLIRNDEIKIGPEKITSNEPKETPIVSPAQKFQEHTDIFYRFTKNIFFSAILRELKEACDTQDIQKAVRYMGEIEKYQKNFRRSPVIATMSRLVRKEGFLELSQLIQKEIK